MTQSKVIGFNTGRLYQADGQRISVGLSEDGSKVLFNDHSRGIWGELTLFSTIESYTQYFNTDNKLQDHELRDLVRLVMSKYDRCQYKMCTSYEVDKLNAGTWPIINLRHY